MFVFKLEKALEHREAEEERIKKEFLLKKNRLDLEKEKFLEIESLIINTIHQYDMLRKGNINLVSLRNYETYLKKIKNDKIKQGEIVEEWQRINEEAKELFINARKEKKILEKLREKKLETYKEEELRKEQKFIDELSNSMYNRRSIDGKR